MTSLNRQLTFDLHVSVHVADSASPLSTQHLQNQRMAESSNAHHEALIDNFSVITGANKERARFYLEAAGWDFPVRSCVCIVINNIVRLVGYVSILSMG